MNQNTTSDNDLQKAIDDITRANGGASATSDTVSNVAKNVAGASAGPMNYVPTDGQVPAGGSATAAPVSVAPPAPIPTPSSGMPVIPTAQEGYATVRASALADLVPLLDKVELPPESKFEIYREVINAGDKSLIPGAYVAAREIADEKVRATALLFIINAIG